MKNDSIKFRIPSFAFSKINEKQFGYILVLFLTSISILIFLYFLDNGLGLAYNDARSHLNIGRRVVEGLKPGFAQIGSVWLPLPHILMIPTIWNDYFWHTGLAGAIQSMVSFVIIGILLNRLLKDFGVGKVGRLLGIYVFISNLNILYLQSTAMTELLLLSTMTLGSYFFIRWVKFDELKYLLLSAFFIMLASLTRYDGWFLLFITFLFSAFITWKKSNKTKTEGIVILFCSLAGVGIAGWLLWNYLIFGDPLFFAFGPYSAHAQQLQLQSAGELPTKKNIILSTVVYLYALFYNSNFYLTLLSVVGATIFYLNKNIDKFLKLAVITLISPLFFNIIALFLGHSVLFIQGISGSTWFNVRYGVMLMPTIAFFIGYLYQIAKPYRILILTTVLVVSLVAIINFDAVTIDDARVGSSQKNVTEVSGWLKEHAKKDYGFIMISAASHDAIIFSSTLSMKRFIHEGTGDYWLEAGRHPSHLARWLIMRTNDTNDSTFKLVNNSGELDRYDKIASYPFADIYQLKEEFTKKLVSHPIESYNK